MSNTIIPQNTKLPKHFGFIYVLQNAEMPEIYKIGMTTRSPHERAAELSMATGVPLQFDVMYYAEVSDPLKQEKRVHKALDKYRVNNGREFFKTDLLTIIQAIKNTGAEFTNNEPPIYSEWSSRPIAAMEEALQMLAVNVEGKNQ